MNWLVMENDSSSEEIPELQKADPYNFSGQKLLLYSIISALFYLIIAWFIYYFWLDEALVSAFDHGITIPNQIITGVLAGLGAAAVIIFFISRPPVSTVLDDYSLFRAIKQIHFTPFDRIQVSLFAGTGEELLFRGAIQPVLGIWVTSFIFIAIHGYVSVRSAGHLIFTLLFFALSMLLGILYETAGLISAMCAHAVYDGVMLWWVDSLEDK